MEEQTGTPLHTETPTGTKVQKKTWIIIGVIGVAILVVGNMYSPERNAQRVMERAFEARGIDADVDMNGDGSFNYSETNDDGSRIQMNAGENVSLPSGWPSNVPLPNNAQLTYAGTVAGDAENTSYMVSYLTTSSLSEIAVFYSDVFKANGWTGVSNVSTGDSVMLGAEYGKNSSVGAYATKDPKGAAVTLTVSMEK